MNINESECYKIKCPFVSTQNFRQHRSEQTLKSLEIAGYQGQYRSVANLVDQADSQRTQYRFHLLILHPPGHLN